MPHTIVAPIPSELSTLSVHDHNRVDELIAGSIALSQAAREWTEIVITRPQGRDRFKLPANMTRC